MSTPNRTGYIAFTGVEVGEPLDIGLEELFDSARRAKPHPTAQLGLEGRRDHRGHRSLPGRRSFPVSVPAETPKVVA